MRVKLGPPFKPLRSFMPDSAPLRETVATQMKEAMKGGDKIRVGALRLIMSALKDREIEGKVVDVPCDLTGLKDRVQQKAVLSRARICREFSKLDEGQCLTIRRLICGWRVE